MFKQLCLRHFLSERPAVTYEYQHQQLVEVNNSLRTGAMTLSEGLAIIREITQSVVVHLDLLLMVVEQFQVRTGEFTQEDVRNFTSIIANISAYYPQLLNPFLPTLATIITPEVLNDYLFGREPDEADVFTRFVRLLKNITSAFSDVAQVAPGDIIYEFLTMYFMVFEPLGDLTEQQFQETFTQRWDAFVSFESFLRSLIESQINWVENQSAIFAKLLANCCVFRETHQEFASIIPEFADNELFLKAFLSKITPFNTCSDELYVCIILSEIVHFEDYCDLNDYVNALVDIRQRRYVRLYDQIISNQLKAFEDDVIFELDDNLMINLPNLLENGSDLECYRLFTEE